MELDERKRRVLYAIVHDYIQTAEPVGSRTVSRRYDLGVSPATIRNEMSDLEEMGLLEQPHTSAGRIPSDLGYRFYVDSLMEVSAPTSQEQAQIRRLLSSRIRGAEQIVQQLARLLSSLTNYTAIVIGPSEQKARLRQVQLVPLNERSLLLVGITDGGLLLNSLIDAPGEVDVLSLEKLQHWLNRRLTGLTLEQIKSRDMRILQNELNSGIELLDSILDELNGLAASSTGRVYLGGTTNMFRQPEFRDFDKVQAILQMLEQEELIWNWLMQSEPGSVSIGAENTFAAMQSCSLVTAEYRLPSGLMGRFGLLGPTRMNYDRVVSLVQHICLTLDQLFE
ncbi:MAG: heat-inducible transcriptional repressor HrcA [Bacillota bacterium]